VYPDDGGQGQGAGGLPDYWRTLVRYRRAVLVASFGGALLGLLIAALMKPVYQASTTLEVLTVNEDFMNMKPTQSAVPGGDSENLSEEETQATLLQSELLLDRVCARLNPDPSLPPQPATSGWRKWLHLRQGGKPSQREMLLSSAVKSLKVSNPPRTRLLGITVDSKDPKLALDFTNVLVQEFIKENIDARWASTQQTGDWLSHEIDETRAKLKDSEDALQAYARDSKLFFIDDLKQTSVGAEKLQEIQQQLSAATSDRIAKQSVFELAKNSLPDALADVLNDASLQSIRARLDDAIRQVASLSAVYNHGYSKLRQAEAEVAALQQASNSRRADLLRRIETDYQSATRREKLLSAAYAVQAREVSGQNEKAVQYNILKREVDSNRQLYDTMLQEMKQASVATALHASNVRVIDPAYVLKEPIFPNFRLNAALGFCAGFIGCFGLILIRERSDRTVRQPGDVKLLASLPELGIIPRLQDTPNRSAWTVLPKFTREHEVASGNNSHVVNTPLLNLAGMWDKRLPITEAFHSAVTSILLIDNNHKSGRVLVVTSVGAGEGKTSIACNLAIAAAKTGGRVLLIDADLRRPRIHDVFGLTEEQGTAEILRSEDMFGGSLLPIQFTNVPGLSVITAGKSREAMNHSFYSPTFSSLLVKSREQYDLVLIDTPPALYLTDARIIGAMSDGVVLVARAGQTSRDSLRVLQERFQEDRIQVVGCILNDWDPTQAPHGYPYYPSNEEAIA